MFFGMAAQPMCPAFALMHQPRTGRAQCCMGVLRGGTLVAQSCDTTLEFAEHTLRVMQGGKAEVSIWSCGRAHARHACLEYPRSEGWLPALVSLDTTYLVLLSPFSQLPEVCACHIPLCSADLLRGLVLRARATSSAPAGMQCHKRPYCQMSTAAVLAIGPAISTLLLP